MTTSQRLFPLITLLLGLACIFTSTQLVTLLVDRPELAGYLQRGAVHVLDVMGVVLVLWTGRTLLRHIALAQREADLNENADYLA
jgi:uncharacterized membrane protein YcjF (UPF0283 family)